MDVPEKTLGNQQNKYWDGFYGGARQTGVMWPSQFAAFVLGEIEGNGDVIDVGCGSGRDALFFASHGLNVIGLDASEAAVDVCRSAKEKWGVANAQFLQAPIEEPNLAERVSSSLKTGKPTVYARFFLHAITDAQENCFLEFAQRLCRDGGMLAVEFRTVRDASQKKVTPDHYRRFLEPMAFLEKAQRHNFSPAYYVEGFGLAKYRADDAYVARCLFNLRR